jgi:hypothetical protein
LILSSLPVFVILVFGKIEYGRTVSPYPMVAACGDPVTVTVSIPFSAVSWLPSPM